MSKKLEKLKKKKKGQTSFPNTLPPRNPTWTSTSDLTVGQRSQFSPDAIAETVKYLHMMQEIWVQFLSWEDPLEKGMATHSSTFAWRIPWTEERGGLQSMRSQRVRHN